MPELRPLTTLGKAAVEIAVTGPEDKSYRVEWVVGDLDRMLSKHIKARVRNGDALDLTGRTVSDLVAFHRGLVRATKKAAKDDVVVETTYLGEAADYDLDDLAKEPTPAEDHDVLMKVRKGSSLTGTKWARALELMGLKAEKVKSGRKLVGYRVALPDMDEALYKVEYGSLTLEGEPEYEYHRDGSPEKEAYEAARDDWREANKAARKVLKGLASKVLGLEDPDERKGHPPRARDYRTDLTIRTCPVCFRDIKASDHTHGKIADHGYTIDPGYRTGSCAGTGRLPWEKSCDPAVEEIPHLLAYSERVEARLAALTSGEVTELKVRGSYDWKTREYEWVAVGPDDYRWESALRSAVTDAKRTLVNLWNGHYGSIPWMRMAVRTWEPVADDHIAVGPPTHPVLDEDYEGKPEVLG